MSKITKTLIIFDYLWHSLGQEYETYSKQNYDQPRQFVENTLNFNIIATLIQRQHDLYQNQFPDNR